MNGAISLNPYLDDLAHLAPLRWTGEVTDVVGLLIESRGPNVGIGDFCEVATAQGRHIRTQVIGFRDGHVLSMPLEETDGLQLGDAVEARVEEGRVEVGTGLLGRVIDGFGKPIDSRGGIEAQDVYPLYGTPGNPLQRQNISCPLVTGVRAIDSRFPAGLGSESGFSAAAG